jgi:hypothetical protein
MTISQKQEGGQSALLPCPFCEGHLAKPTAVDYPHLGLARLHPGELNDGSCPIAGWGFYEDQLLTWNTRSATDTITDLLAALKKATQWMNDPRMGQWNYIEGPHFFADKTRICGEIEDAIARAKGGAS